MNNAKKHGMEFDEAFLAHYKPWRGGELRDSMSMMYRVLRPKIRNIGSTPSSNESVDPSAIARMNERDDYKPENLAEYRDRMP